MRTRTLVAAAASLAMIVSSCRPDEDSPRKPREKMPAGVDEAGTMKEEKEAKKPAKQTLAPSKNPISETPPASHSASVRRDFPLATKVPGKEGFVLSPYSNTVMDVRDIPGGTLVADPTYPPADKKLFRIP